MKKAKAVVLDLLKPTIRGVRFEPNAVTFTARPSLEQLNKLATGVSHVEGGTAWWLGDIGLAIEQDKAEEFLSKNAKTHAARIEMAYEAKKFAREYLRGRAEIIAVDDGYWVNCIDLARVFPFTSRCVNLTVHHHRAALIGAGGQEKFNPTKAQEWLFQAATQGWSASELRRQINMALATNTAPAGAAERNSYQPLDDADKWAVKQKDADLKPEFARSMLTRFQGLITFIDRLKAIAGPTATTGSAP